MNSIMVDNWLLEKIVLETYSHDKNLSEEYAKFLSSIILWDEIYYPYNEMSMAWNYMSDNINSMLHPFDDRINHFEEQAQNLYSMQYKKYPSVIAQGAIRYLLLSNYIGCNYLPAEQRQQFLQIHNPLNIVNDLTRFNFINPVDMAINEHFQEMFSKLGKTNIQIKRPVLVDFIIQNRPDNMSYIDFALHIKNEGPAIEYRKYLSDIEEALEKGNWTLLIDMIQYSNDLVNKLIGLDKKNIISGEFTVCPVPSISFSKEIEIGKRKLHLSFLENLSNFAFHKRILY